MIWLWMNVKRRKFQGPICLNISIDEKSKIVQPIVSIQKSVILK